MISRTRSLGLGLCLLTLVPVLVLAQAVPQGIEKITSVEGITEYRLANGLKVLLFPDPSKETITVNMTYLVGSRHEGYGETGMAHILEHLVFKGTPRHPNIPKELTDHGARPNGSTWTDRTNYFETFTATEANLEWALDLESDRMVNSFIARKDLDSEMTVVRNEFELGENNPRHVLLEKVLAAAYQWHNYGKTTIGARSDIENVPIDRLQAFYRTYYQPDNATLVVAGKIDEARTLRLIYQYFSPIPRPTRKLISTYTAEPTQDGERTVAVRRTGDVQGVLAAYHVPAGSHPDFAVVGVLGRILGDSPSGRLHKALVEARRAATVEFYAFQFKEPGVLLFGAPVRKDTDVIEARDILLRTVEGLGADPVRAEEVSRAETQLLNDIEVRLKDPEQFALYLSEWEGMGDWRLFFLHRDRIRKVAPDDVNRVARAYLKPSNRTVGLFLPDAKPDRAEIPAAPDVQTALKDYRGGQAVAQGETFDPSPANIDARTRRGQVGAGLKLVLLPKQTRANTVNADLTLHFGDENTLQGRAWLPRLTQAMLMRGTKRLTRQQIKDEFDRLKAQVTLGRGAGPGPSFGPEELPGTVGATIQTTRENLPAVIRLVAEVLREPSFPEDEFEQAKQQMLVMVETQRTEPPALALTTLVRHLNPYPKGDPRHSPSFGEMAEMIKSARLEDVRLFHKEFYGTSHAELAVVGDFDAEEIQILATKLFGDWKSPANFRDVLLSYHRVEPLNQAIETPDKAMAVVAFGVPVSLSDEDPDFAALLLGDYMLGGGFLNSRLAVRLRQKEGLSYGVRSMLNALPKQKVAFQVAGAMCAPQNAPKAETAAKEEIARALKDGFTEDEVKAAKQAWLQSRRVSRSQDRELAARLASLAHWDRTMAFEAGLEKQVEALTPAAILEAFRKHIRMEDLSVVKAGDFKKANVTF